MKFNYIDEIEFQKELKNRLSKAIHILYDLEDKTGYNNKKLGRAINILQEVKIGEGV